MVIIYSIIIYIFAFFAFFVSAPIILCLIIFNGTNASKYLIYFCKFMIYVFRCRVRVHGEFPDDETYVIIANHVSFLDVFIIPSVFSIGKKFSAIAASKNFKIPIYAQLLKKMKAVSIDRSNREAAIKGITQAEKLLKEENYQIVILPEGTRTSTGKISKLKKGGFHLAINTKSKILPIVTKGLFKIKPINRWYIVPGIIDIYIDKPIATKNKTVDELLEITTKIFKKY